MLLNPDSTFETTLPKEPDTVEQVGDLQPPEETAQRCDDGTIQQKIADLQGNVDALNLQEIKAKAAGDTGAVKALNEDIEYDKGWIEIFSRLKPCPPTQTASSQTTAVAPLDGALMAAVLAVNYAHSFPNVGAGTDNWNLGGSVILGSSSFGLDGVAAAPTQPWYQGNLDVTGTFGQSYVNHWTTSTGTVGGSYDVIAGPVRFGPAVGFLASTADGYSSQTVNYGGYLQWFVNDRINGFIKGGGFTSHPDNSGWYVGGSLEGYVCPRFALNGGVDFTQYNGLSGYHDTTYSVGAEYLFSQVRPVSIYAGYSYDVAAYDSAYSSYQSHASEVYVGLRLYLNGPNVMTLEDRQRNGEPPPHQFGW